MSSRCALRITEQEKAGPPAFTALLGRERVVAALGEHRCARSRAFAWRVRRCTRSRAFAWRVRRTASPALRAYMPRAHINAPPCCVKRVHERHESPFFGQILTLVYTFLGEALCGFESLARCRKKPEPGDWHGLRASMAERGFGAPLHAAVRCGRSHGFARFAGIRSAFPQLRTFAGFESLTCCRKKPASQRNAGLAFTMAEREGFEPSRRSRAQRFSRPPHSTALPSLRGR